MSFWRDERKKLGAAIPNGYLHKIIKRLMRENRLSEDIAGALTFMEIQSWKLPAKTIKEVKKRFQKEAVHIYLDGKKPKWFYGRKAQAIFRILVDSIAKKIIKGFAASWGLARGHARIIETKEDFAKMRKGDILIAQMTRPEYIPIIRMASAIVTDEGGITCHAAIVSRELGLPCIIGTQTATTSFRDGDIIEVDANKGIIRKIN